MLSHDDHVMITYPSLAITEWMSKWKTNGWLTYSGEDVKNKEDFMRLEKLCQQIDVQWVRVVVVLQRCV